MSSKESRHRFIPSGDPEKCFLCKGAWDSWLHSATKHGEPERIVLGPDAPMPVRMGAMEHEKESILDDQESRNGDRVERARRIATTLWNRTHEPVMVWQIRDFWMEHYQKHVSWEDENGKTHWAGAIFRGGEWVQVGSGKSPYNHHDGNRKLVPKGARSDQNI